MKQKDALAKKIVALLPDHETLTLSQFLKLTQRKPSTVKLRLKERGGPRSGASDLSD